MLRLFDQWLRRPPTTPRDQGRAAVAAGRRGERLAARALRRRGYRILARRWRTPAGEIDLLGTVGHTVVVVEVKTAREGPLPAARIDAAKRHRLGGARRYVASLRAFRGWAVRVDVVLVRLASPLTVKVATDVRTGPTGRTIRRD